MADSSEAVRQAEAPMADTKVFTPAERIHQLNEIDKVGNRSPHCTLCATDVSTFRMLLGSSVLLVRQYGRSQTSLR
jgi:hypothetical protein